ncbi:Tetratricopeptide repeat-containing protein isoform 2 [Theobroma cacao]|uniref:Tetratricopeptide repeat-containing protein isoform 2 n=1 Tax=Theobroma cacao TaxID=3641 RepID=A0A061FVR6_THECC|nr:Tetratricopeptide repeat-containing protein isoform 2 [Theobroma cacao]
MHLWVTSSTYPPHLRFPVKSEAQVEEIRVCTNRTCRRQGSMQTFHILTALAPPDVSVKSCGCLGRCGAGPNVALLPDGQIVGHCGTAAGAAELMVGLWHGGGVGDACNKSKSKTSLDALALRMRAEALVDEGNFSKAERLLSQQAIDLKPFGGVHILYKKRSVARLAIHNYSGALEDAAESLTLAPNYAGAYICQGDAFLAMDQYDAAQKSYSTCLEIDPSIRRSKSFKIRIAKLEEKLATINMSHDSISET